MSNPDCWVMSREAMVPMVQSLLTLVNWRDAFALVQHLFALVWGHQVVWRLSRRLWLSFSSICGGIRDSKTNDIIFLCVHFVRPGGRMLFCSCSFIAAVTGKHYLNEALLADLLADRCSLAVVWLPGWRNISWYSVVMHDHVCLLQHKGTDQRPQKPQNKHKKCSSSDTNAATTAACSVSSSYWHRYICTFLIPVLTTLWVAGTQVQTVLAWQQVVCVRKLTPQQVNLAACRPAAWWFPGCVS